MKKLAGLVAISGIAYIVCGGTNPFIYLLTAICGIIALFYPKEWLE